MALQELQGLPESVVAIKDKCLNRYQREHSANIKEAPRAYQQNEPAKKQNIIEIDCRGLEFTEFIPQVRADVTKSGSWPLIMRRVSGRPRELTQTRNSTVSISLRATGMITTRRQVRRSAFRT